MLNKTIKMNKFLQTLFMFFLIFGFPIISFINSVKIVMGVTIFLLILGVSSCFFYRKFLTLEMSMFNFLYSLCFIFTLILTIISNNYDFSLSFKILSSQIMIMICLLFMSFLDINIEESIWTCFIVQSIIILLCIFSQPFYDLTSPFRAEMLEQHLLAYGRFRGSAISGYQFFGISTMYGYVIIWGILNFKKSVKFICQLLLIIICGILSGRFCITSVFVGMFIKMILLIKKKQVKIILGILLSSILLFTAIVVVVVTISDSIKDPLTKKIFDNYIVEPVESIFSEEGFNSSSTDRLKEMYEFDLSDFYLCGEGKYSNEDGSYFGHVDIGYYRIILYYGIWGIGILFFLYWYFIWFSSRNTKLSLKIAFFLFFLILNLKGDVQLYNNNIIPLLVGYCYFSQPKEFSPTKKKHKKTKVLTYIFS